MVVDNIIFFITWFPWIDFLNYTTFLQLLIIITSINIVSSNNPYYVLLYFFINTWLIGLFLAYYQVELFTGFLWTIEFTVILVGLLLLFYLNVSGSSLKLRWYSILRLSIFFFTFFFTFFYFFISLDNTSNSFFSYIYNIWDDYYEALSNINVNDMYTLTLSYYNLNSFETIIIGVILLIGSVLCIIINKSQYYNRNIKMSFKMNFLNLFNFFTNSYFLRKQNLSKQSVFKPSLHIFKKKK